jgi:hypothetical protein
MTLTIQLSPDLEARLLRQAASAGMDASAFVVTALASHLEQSTSADSRCGKDEAGLLSAISEGLPEPLWQRYRALVSRRENETLSPNDHAELIALSDQIEEDHARRMEHLAKLALLRGVSLAVLMEQMDIRPPHA